MSKEKRLVNAIDLVIDYYNDNGASASGILESIDLVKGVASIKTSEETITIDLQTRLYRIYRRRQKFNLKEDGFEDILEEHRKRKIRRRKEGK
jgi:hypothetical protein